MYVCSISHPTSLLDDDDDDEVSSYVVVYDFIFDFFGGVTLFSLPFFNLGH